MYDISLQHLRTERQGTYHFFQNVTTFFTAYLKKIVNLSWAGVLKRQIVFVFVRTLTYYPMGRAIQINKYIYIKLAIKTYVELIDRKNLPMSYSNI